MICSDLNKYSEMRPWGYSPWQRLRGTDVCCPWKDREV